MNIDFSKGLVPAVIQDDTSLQVLMVGFMDEKAYQKTLAEGKVTFFSRSKQRLWTKGETSGNFLYVKDIKADCDGDTLLIRVDPAGPVCHTGNNSCFDNDAPEGFLYKLEKVIEQRIADDDPASYTNKIFKMGVNKSAQKVGEEAVEVVIEAKDNNIDMFLNESADLLYHLLILFKVKGVKLKDVEGILKSRHK